MQVQKPYSDETARLIDEEVQKMVSDAYAKTKELLLQHKDDVDKVARRLLDREVLHKEDMIELLGKRPFREKSTYEEIIQGTNAPGARPADAAPEPPAAPTPSPAV